MRNRFTQIVLFLLITGFVCTGVKALFAQIQAENGRGEQLTVVFSDRGGGALENRNGRGDRADVSIQWYVPKTLVNGRGEVLELGEVQVGRRNASPDWYRYKIHD